MTFAIYAHIENDLVSAYDDRAVPYLFPPFSILRHNLRYITEADLPAREFIYDSKSSYNLYTYAIKLCTSVSFPTLGKASSKMAIAIHDLCKIDTAFTLFLRSTGYVCVYYVM